LIKVFSGGWLSGNHKVARATGDSGEPGAAALPVLYRTERYFQSIPNAANTFHCSIVGQRITKTPGKNPAS